EHPHPQPLCRLRCAAGARRQAAVLRAGAFLMSVDIVNADCSADLLTRVHAALASNTPLRVRGGGSKDFYGRAVDGAPIDTRGHRGVVSYDPSELVVSVRAGTPLADLEAVLADAGQQLACEPPHFGAGATVGGMVAAGLSGPRRP